jgi:HPt (histidine-containing phosphotransfer) domain-containing protein
MIDWERVRILHEDLGEEGFAAVVALYFEETDAAFDRLAAAPTARETEQAFHFLRSSALNMGFARLADICARAERQAAAGNATGEDAEAARTAYAAARTEFLADLGMKIGNGHADPAD